VSAHAAAHISQHDARYRLLLVAQGFVERFEGSGECLHALGALGHPLARAIEHVRQRRGSCALLAPLLHSLLEVLARHDVVSMLVEEPDLEDAFLELYEAAS